MWGSVPVFVKLNQVLPGMKIDLGRHNGNKQIKSLKCMHTKSTRCWNCWLFTPLITKPIPMIEFLRLKKTKKCHILRYFFFTIINIYKMIVKYSFLLKQYYQFKKPCQISILILKSKQITHPYTNLGVVWYTCKHPQKTDTRYMYLFFVFLMNVPKRSH